MIDTYIEENGTALVFGCGTPVADIIEALSHLPIGAHIAVAQASYFRDSGDDDEIGQDLPDETHDLFVLSLVACNGCAE